MEKEEYKDFCNKFYSTFNATVDSFSNESLIELKNELEASLLHMELNPNLLSELELINIELGRRDLLNHHDK